MKTSRFALAMALVLPVSLLAVGPAQASDDPPQGRKDKGAAPAGVSAPEVARGVILSTTTRSELARARAMVDRLPVDVTVARTRALTPTSDLLLFDELASVSQAEAVAAALEVRPGVLWAEADARVRHSATPYIPNDTLFGEMKPIWNGGGASDYSIKAPLIWRAQDGTPDVVVAIIDTGITRHPDLDANVVPGYDFVSDVLVANDGDGWDSNPSDPGDWITWSEDYSGYFEGCGESDSSWHGTHVAGTVGAVQGNGLGVTGVAPGARIQAVRVLGKCGGWSSDIAAGITWASGGVVSGVPLNPTPAKVLNLSLGGNGTCAADSAYAEAISGAISRGSTVVVAAGNENEPITNHSPANCQGVIAVTSVDIDGRRAVYSNYGALSGQATIAAPGGDFEVDDGVLSTLNDGARGPANASYAYYQGTSMAAPHVAGAAALLYSGGYTSPTKVRETLVAAVQPFPLYSSRWDCTQLACGAGILDVGRLDLAPPVSVPDPPTGVTAQPGNQQVSVSWTAPAWIGGLPITSYAVTSSPGGLRCSTTGALSCTVTGLTNGTSYTFSVTATNERGTSTASVPSLAVTPRTTPSAPTGVQAVPGVQRVYVSWTAPTDNGGSPITGYEVTASPGGQGCTTTGSLSCEVAGLSASSAYAFSVIATNVVGSSGSSTASSPVTPRSPVPGGTVAWGIDSFCGQTDIPAVAARDISALAGGWNFSVALAGGRVVAWGCDDADQLMVPSDAQTGVTDIATGFSHALALREGRVLAWGAWGNENYGQANVPSEALSGVSAISAGGWTSMALKSGRVIAWGNNGNDQASVPQDALNGVSAIANGAWHSLALKDGRVIAWGTDDAGQSSVPTEAQSGVTAIAAGTWHSLALKDGRVIAWGAENDEYDFGQARVPSEAKFGVVAIAAGDEHSVALKADGRVIAWGGNEFGQASVPSVAQAGVVAIAAGGLHTLALRSGLPAPPTQVSGAPGNGQVAVSWQAPSDLGGSTISSYTVTSSPGGLRCSTTGALTCTVTGLTNGTSYTFSVTATNGVGTSLPSFASSPVTPKAPVTLPGAVTALRATPQRGAVRFTWTTPSSLGGASSVTYEHRVGAQNWVRTTGTAVTVRGRAGTRITIQVRAVNTAGPGPASTVTGTPR